MIAAKFSIEGDGKNALAAFTQVKRGAHELSKDINSELRNTLIGAFSIEAIKEAASATIEFAEKIEKTSNRLNITTDNVQALRLAARGAGKDFSIMEKAFTNLEKSASKAIGGSGAQKKAFSNLGITDEDLKHLDKVSLLSKMMAGTAGKSRAESEGNLSAIFGSRMSGSLMAMAPKLANFEAFKNEKKEQGAIAKTEDIEALADLKDRWLEITDAVKTQLIPALAGLLDVLFSFGRGTKQLVQVVSTWLGALLANAKDFTIKRAFKASTKAVLDIVTFGSKAGMDISQGKGVLESITDEVTSKVKGVAEAAFGKNAVEQAEKATQDLLTKQAEEDKKLEQERQKKRQERQEKQNKMNGDADRKAQVKADQKEKVGSHIDNVLKGDSGIRIGGLMAADTGYRVSRLQWNLAASAKETAENTKRTAEAVEMISDKLDDPDFGDEGGLGGFP